MSLASWLLFSNKVQFSSVSCVFLLLQESDSVACSMRQGTVLLKHKKIVSGQPAYVWQWSLSKKVVATVCHLHYDTKSEQYACVR